MLAYASTSPVHRREFFSKFLVLSDKAHTKKLSEKTEEKKVKIAEDHRNLPNYCFAH